MTKDEERERRLAEALRDNLRKRKARVREESETPDQVRGDEEIEQENPSPRL